EGALAGASGLRAGPDEPMASSLLPLPGDEVHVWFAFADRVTDPRTLHSYEALLSPDEDERRQRYALVRNRHQFLLARGLLRTTLSRYADAPPAAWVFPATGHGKPEIAAPAGLPPLRFNLSHTDGLVACAVAAGREVGVDVEDVGRREVSEGLARYCLS